MTTFGASCRLTLLAFAMLLEAGGVARAGIDVPLEREARELMSHGERDRFFSNVRNRIAAFTFDDPHAIGLGDPIAFLLAKKLLFSARVSSVGIVNYRESVDRDFSGKLAYFDQVDAITEDQGFLLAIWGHLSQTEDGVRADSFLQVPANVGGTPFFSEIRLPKQMGGGTLTARLKPDRIQLQSLDIDRDHVSALRAAAAEVATLRAEPDVFAATIGRIPEDQPYSIVDSQEDWVRLRFADGTYGWTSVDAFCIDVCRDLMDVATFINDAVALTSNLPARSVPESLTREAAAMSDQLAALVALTTNPRKAIEIIGPWAVEGFGSPSAGGAGFANLFAVASVAAELERASALEPEFNRIRLDREVVERIAQRLAEASVAHPSDLDILENLAVLFAYLGDERRRSLALQIAATLKAR